MRSGLDAPAPSDELKHGDTVLIDGREAVFLYSRGKAATIRFKEGARPRVVSLAKLRKPGPVRAIPE